MGLTNFGAQTLTWSYKHVCTSSEFDRLLRNIIKPGVTKGWGVSLVSGTTIQIAPGHGFLNAKFGVEDEFAIHMRTSAAFNIAIPQTTVGVDEIVYWKWDYQQAVINYADLLHRKATDPAVVNEVPIARLIYTLGTISSIEQTTSVKWGGIDADDSRFPIRSDYFKLMDALTPSPLAGANKGFLYKKSGTSDAFWQGDSTSEVNLSNIPRYSSREEQTIANAATLNLGASGGVYEIFDITNFKRHVEVFFAVGDTNPHVIYPGGELFSATAANPGTINVYESGGDLIIENQLGSSVTLAIWRKQ